jgi:hypothetical protein
MSKLSAIESSPPSTPPDLHAKGWDDAIEAEMAVLSELERSYEQERARIRQTPGAPGPQARLLEQLEQQHRNEREPHVLALADLHQRMMDATFSRRLS